MALFLYGCALVLILLAAAAFIVYWCARINPFTTGPTDCSGGFASLTLFVGYEYYALAVAPVLTSNPRSPFLLGPFCWSMSSSFEVPAHGARIFCGACCSVPSHPVLDPFGAM